MICVEVVLKKLAKRLVSYFKKTIFLQRSSVTLHVSPSASGSVILPAAAPGGIGDDAMVGGAIAALRMQRAGEPVSVLVPRKHPSSFRFDPLVEHLHIFSGWTPPIVEASKLLNYQRLFVLGADILDGAYNLPDALKRVRLASLCAAQGMDARIIGFSLNDNPHPEMLAEFRRRNNVRLYLRDPLSYERATRFIGGDVHLSADVAFLLEPKAGEYSLAVEAFAWAEKTKGNSIYGLNIHDLLGRFSPSGTFEYLISSIAQLIETHKDCSFVMVPHDYRPGVDDRVPLRRIYEQLKPADRERVLFLNAPIRAAEIKQLCNSLDGVLTGRMHLAIAALGTGVPVMGIVYQGKFEGTLSYFDLDRDCTLTPIQAADADVLNRRFNVWRQAAADLTQRVKQHLPHVKSLALSNFH